MKCNRWVGVCCAVLWLFTPFVAADEVIISPIKDNTLYEHQDGALSNGAGEYFFAGKTGIFADFRLHRALIAFDIAGSVPPGSAIDSAALRLHLASAAPGSGEQPVSLHRTLADWGEGKSDAEDSEGRGAPASAGDATWLHTFFDSDFWASAGGDFEAAASATELVGITRTFYTWETPEMAADVQSWLDDPASSFGWTIRGNETENQTARRFNSREYIDDAGLRPVLTINFTPSGGCDPCDMDCDGQVNAFDIEPFLCLLFDANCMPCDTCTGDVDGNGVVDAFDIEPFLNCLFP